MKRRIICILMSCLLLSACQGDPAQEIPDLPQTLRLTAQLPQEYPAEVTSYQAEYYAVDEETAVSTFMRHEPQERLEYAVGPQYFYEAAGETEYVNIYSGVVRGGFNYGYHAATETRRSSDVNSLLRKQRPQDFVRRDVFPLKMGNADMEAAGAEDLDFLPYADALADLESRLAAVGLPEHELLTGGAHSLSLLNRNREIYNQAAKEHGEKPLTDTFTKEDEYYYFEFRQVKDGIPFCNADWPRLSTDPVIPCIDAVIDSTGIADFSAFHLCVTGDALSTEPIISPQEALGVYVKEYSKAIHFQDTEILDIELNYIVNMDSGGLYARPAWMITTATEIKAGEIENLDFDLNEYEITAVSAYSGVILERGTDMR